MQPYGGFEHNLQSLRVVDELEERYAAFPGLNLTFETREGILKHCSLNNARQLGELGERFIQRRQPTLEAQIANLADEIAYNNHDLDDGLRAGLIALDESARGAAVPASARRRDRRCIRTLQGRRLIHEVVRRMINYVVTDLVETTQAAHRAAAPAECRRRACAARRRWCSSARRSRRSTSSSSTTCAITSTGTIACCA